LTTTILEFLDPPEEAVGGHAMHRQAHVAAARHHILARGADIGGARLQAEQHGRGRGELLMQHRDQRRRRGIAEPRPGRGVAEKDLPQFIGGKTGRHVLAHQQVEPGSKPRLAPAVGPGDRADQKRQPGQRQPRGDQRRLHRPPLGQQRQPKAGHRRAQKPGHARRQPARNDCDSPEFGFRSQQQPLHCGVRSPPAHKRGKVLTRT
jgi:hypothetical protein